MENLEGRVVVITGAASGIGRALASRCARDGARVALLDRDAAALSAAAAEAARASPPATPAPIALACDVTDLASCQDAVARVVAAFGGIDVLVNNAGISHVSAFEDTDPAVLRRVLEVNFFGAVHCTKAALPHLLARRGVVVAISSVAGFAPLAWRTGYAASKHALHGFFDSLRAEVAARGVSVTLVCPSFVRTGIGEHALGGDGGAPRMPRGEGGRPVEPAEAAEAIHRAIVRRERLVVVGALGRVSWWVARLAPAVYERLMRRRLRAAQEASGGAGPPL